MRDLENYQHLYADQPYERYLIHYRKRKILEILSRYPHSILMEVGCGLDPIFNDLTSFDKLYVVEPAKLFYNNALSQVVKSSKNDAIEIKNKVLEDCIEEFKNIEFDFIIVSCLLHELANPKEFLSVINQIVSKRTLVHINVPNAKSFHRLLAVEMGIIKNEFQKSERNIKFQQNTVFEMDSLLNLLEEGGFEVVESGSFSFKPFTHDQMEKMVQSGLLTEKMLEGFYRMEKYLPNLGSEIYANAIRKD